MKKKIKVYGAMWCKDCCRATDFFKEQEIDYDLFDTDRDSHAAKRMLEINGGVKKIPTVVFPDGSFLIEPSNTQLEKKLDLPVK